MIDEKPAIRSIKLKGLDDTLMVDVPYFDYKQKKLIIEAASEIKLFITYDIEKHLISSKLPLNNPDKDDSSTASFDIFGNYFVFYDAEDESEGYNSEDDSKRKYSLSINALVPTSVGMLHMIINDGTFGFYGPYVCQEMIEMLM